MQKFILKSIEIEDLAQLIYQEFYKNKRCSEELLHIWQQMAQDEGDHAQGLRLALRLHNTETFLGIRTDCPNPEELKGQLEEMLEKAKTAGFSEYEMLRNAVTLENRFRKFHATYALVFKDPGLFKTFNALARADAEHLEGLNSYITKYKASHSS